MKPVDEPVARLESVWESGAAFLREADRSGPLLRFPHAAAEGQELPPAAVPGALVQVVLRFADRAQDFRVHARVVERATVGERRGLVLQLLAEEGDRQELVLAAAEGESIPYRRRHRARRGCRLAVAVGTPGGRTLEGVATDISERGLHLRLGLDLVVNTRVDLAIAFADRAGPFTVSGRVASVVTQGPQAGVGIEFLFDSAAGRDALATEVGRVRGPGPGEGPGEGLDS